MNSELCRQALNKVGNPNVLVNIISRRVRQLTTGSGATSRPYISETGVMGAADIALTELVEGKLEYKVEALQPPVEPEKKRKK